MFRATESRITTLAAEWWRLVQVGNTGGLSDGQAERCFDAADAIIGRLVELPAADESDFAAKVLICACEYRNGEPLPGTVVYALVSSTLADAGRFADPELKPIAENAFRDDETNAPDRSETRRRSPHRLH